MCKNIQVSGAHEYTQSIGALYEQAGSWERPRVYAPSEPESWRRTDIFEQVRQEASAVRQSVGLGDFSAFAKFEIVGVGAQQYLNQVCANRIPFNIGSTCLTLLLNRRGTIEAEAVILKKGENRYYLVTGVPSELRVWDWLTIHCQMPMHNVEITNHTNSIGILTLAGPNSRKVLQRCTKDDVSHAQLPWLRGNQIAIDGINCWLLRLSFTGELAFEIHAPNKQLGQLWNRLYLAGDRYDIAPFGSKALDSLRLEKFYRGGHELPILNGIRLAHT